MIRSKVLTPRELDFYVALEDTLKIIYADKEHKQQQAVPIDHARQWFIDVALGGTSYRLTDEDTGAELFAIITYGSTSSHAVGEGLSIAAMIVNKPSPKLVRYFYKHVKNVAKDANQQWIWYSHRKRDGVYESRIKVL